MKLPRRKFLHLAAGVAALPALSRVARAQSYPTRPVRVIVPYPPGGAPDIVARLMGQWISDRLGQQFIIENRPGAGGNIGTEAAVRAPSRFCVAGKNTRRPAMLTEYFRRQADICLRLSLVTSSEEGRYQMIAKAREYTAKADAIKAREAESKSPLTAIVAQGA